MAHWIRLMHDGTVRRGTLDGDEIELHAGAMFEDPAPSGERVRLDEVEIVMPCSPSKMIGLWNNLAAVAEKNNLQRPADPLYLFKPPSCFLPPGGEIVRPKSYAGNVIYEGELGIVIGKRCVSVEPDEVDDCIFGYTCVNDVTAIEIVTEDPSFAQWCRAKSFDTFGAFGPAIATHVDPSELTVTTTVDGEERQRYPVSDMFFTPQEQVCRISRDMTLEAGDIITCGTSLGVQPMETGCTVEVEIRGIGRLTNTFV